MTESVCIFTIFHSYVTLWQYHVVSVLFFQLLTSAGFATVSVICLFLHDTNTNLDQSPIPIQLLKTVILLVMLIYCPSRCYTLHETQDSFHSHGCETFFMWTSYTQKETPGHKQVPVHVWDMCLHCPAESCL